MHVEQKQVTIVNLHDGKRREFVLLPDERGYRLTAVSNEEVVNLLLSAHDLHKLWREVAKHEAPPAVKTHPMFEECITASAPPAPNHTSALDWLAFN